MEQRKHAESIMPNKNDVSMVDGVMIEHVMWAVSESVCVDTLTRCLNLLKSWEKVNRVAETCAALEEVTHDE